MLPTHQGPPPPPHGRVSHEAQEDYIYLCLEGWIGEGSVSLLNSLTDCSRSLEMLAVRAAVGS